MRIYTTYSEFLEAEVYSVVRSFPHSAVVYKINNTTVVYTFVSYNNACFLNVLKHPKENRWDFLSVVQYPAYKVSLLGEFL